VSVLLAVSLLLSRPALADWPNDPLVNLAVSTAATQQNGGWLVSDGSGGAIISWTDGRAGKLSNGFLAYDVYAQHVLATGVVDPAWPVNGQALCDTTARKQGGRIVSDGAGGAIVVWQDGRASGVGGFDIYAQHVLSNGTVDPLWPRQGRALCTAALDQINPVALADGKGGAIVGWQDQRSVTTADDIYAQHVQASGVVDPVWPADGRALCTAVGLQRSVTMVAGASGSAIVAWQDGRAGGGSSDHVYAERVLADGTVDPAWPANGRALCAAVGAQVNPAFVADGLGGGIISWSDGRQGTTNTDIYAQHVLAGGAVDPAWPANGRAGCTAAGNQVSPVIVGDGASGAIVGWVDFRGGTTPDVYAQHVLGNGAVDPEWPADGRALCTAPYTQASLGMAADAAGGAIVTWMDNRLVGSQDFDVYAQHVTYNGTVDPLWPADGRALCTAVGQQASPRVIADGAGGAIAAWTDMRSDVGDIYAQRVQANGSLGGSVGVPRDGVTELVLDAVHPNPWRGGALALSFSLAGGAPATLEVIDIAGRRIASQRIFNRGDGRGSATLAPGRRLAPGVYLVSLRQGGAVRTRRFVVLD
jgi:hypothetical protein